ncbi:c-type cytochrome [Paraherbaspirillum soli]|uniref:C-type cytochrome n=1 Tax=Paraherbaspirillum soli TaxID=631222 RepID=A0ABW0MAJ0_9BURK
MKKIIAGVLFLLSTSVSINAFAGGNIAAGEAAVKKYGCASCHGADFHTPIDPSYPKLAGQPQDYLQHALIAYQRGNDGPYGRSNAIMGPQAKALSHQDVQDVAAYLHSLPTNLVLRK